MKINNLKNKVWPSMWVILHNVACALEKMRTLAPSGGLLPWFLSEACCSSLPRSCLASCPLLGPLRAVRY